MVARATLRRRQQQGSALHFGREIRPGGALALTALSFVLPLLAWVLISYVPWIWHPDVKLDVSAERANVTTVYTAGDRVSRQFLPEFQQAIRAENAALLQAPEGTGGLLVRRDNQKKLRQLGPLAVANGWLSPPDRENDAKLYEITGRVADGIFPAGGDPALSPENLAILRHNWELLSRESPVFDARKLPTRPLLSLVPQGRLSNPDFLPSPDEVLRAGWRIFTAPAEPGKPSLWDRLGTSVRIILSGFLISCVIGVPLGVACGTHPAAARLCEPFVDFFRYMPAPAFSTLLVAIFAARDEPKIALVVLGTLFQMILVVAKTTRQLDRALVEAAQTLGAKGRQIFTQVVVPGILPDLYNDLRILLGWSWTWLVIAELVGVKTGLTEFIETQGRWRNFENVYPVIGLIGIVGFGTDQFLGWLRGHLFPYTRRVRRTRKRRHDLSAPEMPLTLGAPSRGEGVVLSK